MWNNASSVSIILTVWAATATAHEGHRHDAPGELPTPHYSPRDDDPDWLATAVQLHGHLGPWAIAGTRAGMAGRQAIDAQGYFDLDITCLGPFDKPPKACFLDGIQVATGATMGKGNLHWKHADEISVTVRNTKTGQTVELRPTKQLMKLLVSFKPEPLAADHDHDVASDQAGVAFEDDHTARLERIARTIAHLDADQLFAIVDVDRGSSGARSGSE